MKINPKDPRITKTEVNCKLGPGKDGTWSIYCLKNVPGMVSWYSWNLDHNWMINQIEHLIGWKIKLYNEIEGNGHGYGEIELIEPLEGG